MNAQKFRFMLGGLIILAIVATGVIGYFGINLLRQEVTKVDHIKIEAEVNDEARASAFRAEQQFDDPHVQKIARSLEQLIPEPSYRDQFIADVDAYAATTGVGLQSITFLETPSAPVVPIEGAEAVTITLGFAADVAYQDYISFVEKLENNLQHIRVVSLTLTPLSEDRTVLSAPSINIVLYVSKK